MTLMMMIIFGDPFNDINSEPDDDIDEEYDDDDIDDESWSSML